MSEQTIEITAHRSELVVVAEECPERAYLQLTIPPTIARVESIVMEVVSHDQGFADDRSMSYTIFDANIIDPRGHARARIYMFHNAAGDGQRSTKRVTFPNDRLTLKILHTFEANDTEAKITIVGTLAAFKGIGKMISRTDSALAAEDDLYSPLDASRKETRLVRICPGDGQIICEIEQTALDATERPAYQAISYCWGNEQHSKRIRLSGQPFDISPNLYDCLAQLRSDGVETPLWIDAICINQHDTTERASQVRMMPKIYSSAARVIIWLGDGSEAADEWWQKRLEETVAKHPFVASSFCKDESVQPISETELWDGSSMESIAHDIDISIVYLLKLAWFQRVWVLQEVFNAGDVLVMYGHHKLSWTLILQLNARARSERQIMGHTHTCMPELFTDLFALARTKQSDDDESLGMITFKLRDTVPDILDTLIAGLDFAASDPRDKLFALLGFTRSIEEMRIEVDYEKDVAIHYRDFTRSWIIVRKSLRVLSAVHCSTRRTWLEWMPGLPVIENPLRPSWSFWHDGRSTFKQSTLGLKPPALYNASGDTQVDTELLEQLAGTDILPLRGIKLNTIVKIERFPFYDAVFGTPEDQATHAPLVNAYQQLFDANNSMNVYSLGSLPTANISRAPSVEHTWNHARIHNTISEGTHTMDCHGDAWFTGADGLKGLCPHTARPGDMIVVLFGGKIPYLVRPCSYKPSSGKQLDGIFTSVQFVGECFVPQYMDGKFATSHLADSEMFALA